MFTKDQENPQNQNADYNNPETEGVDEQEEDAVDVFAEITAEDFNDSDAGNEDQTLDEGNFTSGDDESESDGSQSGDGEQQPDQLAQSRNDNSQQETDGAETDGEDDLKSRNAKLQNDLRANSNRVRALNKHLAEARETIKKLQENNAPTVDDEQLAELENDFPEAAKLARAYAERLVNSLRSDLAPVHSAIDSNLEAQQSDFEQQEADRLMQLHPDVSDILHGAQKAQFHQWLNQQSEGVKHLYNSPTADDAIALLDLYKRDYAPATPPTTHANPRPSSGAPVSTPRRKADLSAHAELPRHGPSRIGTEPDDPVAIFNAIAD